MNCETCQELIHDLIDGSISHSDESILNTHLKECLDCESVRQDLETIVGFGRAQRNLYEAPPNEHALWLRIRNVIEAELPHRVVSEPQQRRSFLGRLMGHSWELSLPQLAASTVAIVLLVSLVTVVGLRRWSNPEVSPSQTYVEASSVKERIWQQQQVIDYWNQRVELKKARWSQDMRAAFERNLRVIDQDVTNSLNALSQDPHDEVSEQLLNKSLNDKIAYLKDFSDL